jgi:hypothetical protein
VDYIINEPEREGICIVRVSGELRRPDDSRVLQNLASETMLQKSVQRFLFDMREATIVGDTMGAYQAGVEPVMQGLRVADFKVALVYSEIQSEHQFMETVLVNRGFSVRVFTDMDEALAWLKIQGGEDPALNLRQ